MKCWVCSREAKGFSHTDTRQRVGTPARYPIDWVFCSRRCQHAFHSMYGSWVRAIDNESLAEACMVDATELELQSMRKCLKFFGEAAAEIGFDKPLGSYSEAEALSVINAIVTAYVEAMTHEHEQNKYPPVRMTGKPVSDPIKDAAQALSTNPFADMEDDLPWEVKP
jgi:hypothetical protein